MIRISMLLFILMLAACSTVEKRALVPTSEYREPPVRTGDAASATPVGHGGGDRIEISGDSIPAGTSLEFVLLDTVSSATARVGDIFRLKSRTAVVVDGVEVLPRGLNAHGEVIHADNRGLIGKPGELLLKLRAVDWQGRSIRLRNSVGGVAKDKTGQVVTIQILFGVAVFFVGGNEIEIPADSIILGELAEAIAVPANAQAPEVSPTTEAR